MVGLPPALVNIINEEISKGKYSSRSQFVSEAIRKYIISDETRELKDYQPNASTAAQADSHQRQGVPSLTLPPYLNAKEDSAND